MRKEADRTDVLSAKRTAMVKCTVISRPSQSVVQMLSRKICDRELRERLRLEHPDAVGICQGSVLEMMEAGDIAEKASGVTAGELGGSCPQHITCLAILGSISAVNAAVDAVCTKLENR